MIRTVTFEDFAELARRRGVTADVLIELFRDKFGDVPAVREVASMRAGTV
jgi:hypothetical protein